MKFSRTIFPDSVILIDNKRVDNQLWAKSELLSGGGECIILPRRQEAGPDFGNKFDLPKTAF